MGIVAVAVKRNPKYKIHKKNKKRAQARLAPVNFYKKMRLGFTKSKK